MLGCRDRRGFTFPRSNDGIALADQNFGGFQSNDRIAADLFGLFRGLEQIGMRQMAR
jgi:hypothetical protein